MKILNMRTEDPQIYKWLEPEKAELNKILIAELFNKLTNRFLVWHKWHTTICGNKKEITIEEMYEDEKIAGMDFMKDD